jgi:serine/threonine protein phosphatase PrpC
MRFPFRLGSRPAEPDTPLAAENPPSGEAEPGIIGKLMIEAFGASDPGCVRNNNEDYFLVAPALGLYVVADGMGGAQAGEHASKLAVDTVRECIEKANGDIDPRVLVSAFEEANRRVMDKASQDPSMEGMGTTMVAALEMGADLVIASVGDSRVYIYENGALSAITEDQTWVNEVGRRLGLDEESLRTHPMRHVLTMAIGVSEQLRVLTYLIKPAPGLQVLLCSDGLHGVAEEAELSHALGSSNPLEAKCHELIAAARERGGPDNITAVILKTP